jgi:hypothetical protein
VSCADKKKGKARHQGLELNEPGEKCSLGVSGKISTSVQIGITTAAQSKIPELDAKVEAGTCQGHAPWLARGVEAQPTAPCPVKLSAPVD